VDLPYKLYREFLFLLGSWFENVWNSTSGTGFVFAPWTTARLRVCLARWQLCAANSFWDLCLVFKCFRCILRLYGLAIEWVYDVLLSCFLHNAALKLQFLAASVCALDCPCDCAGWDKYVAGNLKICSKFARNSGFCFNSTLQRFLSVPTLSGVALWRCFAFYGLVVDRYCLIYFRLGSSSVLGSFCRNVVRGWLSAVEPIFYAFAFLRSQFHLRRKLANLPRLICMFLHLRLASWVGGIALAA